MSAATDPGPRRTWTAADLHYPDQLPVVGRREEILDALRDHQVVVVAGETGSGKTTQLPKMLLEVGRGQAGQIGHTQPRRIAARSVAERMAEELRTELGDAVGYQVRFTDHSSARTQVKVMTDGILLAELQRDRDLRRYDAIVIDEAHERSLNIDFILGYLRQLLPRRPDLAVVVTSATIDPQRFADHFTLGPARPVPVIEVSGRTYPVEVRYRPLVDPDRPDEPERDQVTGICDAVEELWTEARHGQDEDILVFLSGEREIRDAHDALAGLHLPNTEILPLYARLSAAEQHRVFRRAPGRRVVLATNVAETSLTVPGIRYVVDTGTARISRYSQRTKVQRLPIEPVSQASALQRSGRCGRVSDGVAIRLYAEADFESRPAFTEPEILRTSLASVILQMTSLGLGDVRRFPFVDAPDARQVADGVRLLEELGAFAGPKEDAAQADPEGRPGARRGRGRRGSRDRGGVGPDGRRLTAYGRTLARMPIDPRLGRMVIEADRLGCTAEVLVLVAALSIQDPRERPAEKRTQADQAHARFRQENSDFATLLALWDYLRDRQKALSGSAFRRMCVAEYLHYLRVREWQDVHAQLRRTCKDVRIDPSRRTSREDGTPDLDLVHRALLAGLLSHVGLRDEARRDYQGARGARFSISPGSALFRRQPDYVMAAELVETTKVWARTTARIDPRWAEEAGAHVVKRSYSEPRWSRRQGAAVATERVTLYGVPLVADRTVQLGRIDAGLARELFIRHALVEGDWDTRHAFWRRNEQLVRRLIALEERARRRDLVVDDEILLAFYDERLPAEVVSARHFDTWWKGASREQPHLLDLTEELLTRGDADRVSADDYPRAWRQGDLELRLSYQFEPGHDDDGVTVHVPLEVLNQVEDVGFDWQVPGLREDLAVALVRALPKSTRRAFVPVPDHARTALRVVGDRRDEPFTTALADGLRTTTGIRVPPEEWDVARVPPHLRMRFVVEDGRRRVVGSGRDLTLLKEELAGHVQHRISRVGAQIERVGLTTWDIGELPTHWEGRAGRHTVQGFPALVDRGSTVDLRIVPDEPAAAALTRRGVRRLLLLATSPPWKRVLAGLSNADKLALARNPHGSVPALLEDALACAVDAIVAEYVGDVRTREQFDEALGKVRAHVAPRVLQVLTAVQPVLDEAAAVDRRLGALTATASPPRWLAATLADVRAQRESLVRPGFVADTGLARLPDVARYLRAAGVRLDRAMTNAREPVLQESVDRVEGVYADLVEELGPDTPEASSDPVRDLAWMIEELRVSLFAQSLGTAYPVSEKRVLAAVAAAR
ncbi:ATP-dependent helicase [Nostocoides japonicum T1-X7]|uniref:ATP-dependent helicase n=1 Tax=Nostocoides japonicum T1-X7 TaxID=1194083 RepID=A0A077M7E3_9MICO|nr:ATP-dependent RNA helicase HrpA [Tetrasphaera japonica]CCH80064.1 ATP-dependent helicase [Tetrasphaera japonica T1-X7]